MQGCTCLVSIQAAYIFAKFIILWKSTRNTFLPMNNRKDSKNMYRTTWDATCIPTQKRMQVVFGLKYRNEINPFRFLYDYRGLDWGGRVILNSLGILFAWIILLLAKRRCFCGQVRQWRKPDLVWTSGYRPENLNFLSLWEFIIREY